jgi:hypothetical protein
VPLVVSSVSPVSGGNNGGYFVNLIGSGFPLDKSQVSISVCGNLATIKSITNININF